MLKITLISLLLLCLSSCSKDVAVPSPEVVPPIQPPNAEDYYPLTKGNYWVYDYYYINTNTGKESYGYRDSVYITGDTIIHGKQFKKERHTYCNQQFSFRDSSGCMIYHDGSILFSVNNFTDTLDNNISTQMGGYTIFEKMLHQDTLITTPVGNFHSISFASIWYFKNDPIPKYEHVFYGKGLGMSQYAHWYLPHHITKIEGRLVKYHLN